LTFSPEITLAMKKPEIMVIKDQAGMNVLTLAKSAPAGEKPVATGSGSLPAIALRARLGLDIQEAKVGYADRLTKTTFEMNALNVRARDLSLSRPTQIHVTANLDSQADGARVAGPFKLDIQASPEFTSSGFQKAVVVALVDLDKLEVKYGDLFHKTSGVPMNLNVKLDATKDSAKLEFFKAVFHNAELSAKGGVKDWNAPTGGVIDFTTQAKPIALAAWAQLIPMLKAYELSGTAAFDAKVQGTTQVPDYEASFALNELKAKAPLLKAQPEINVVAHVVTNKLDKFDMTFEAPGCDLHVQGTAADFSNPKVAFRVDSKGMDLDQLMEFPAQTAAPAPAPSATPKSKGAPAGAPASDYDKMLEPLRKSKIFAQAEGNIDVAVAFVQAKKTRMQNLGGRMSLKKGIAALEKFHAGLFDGQLAGSASVNLLPKTPSYQFAGEVKGLNMKKAVESQYALFKNTVVGVASFQMKGQGASFNPDTAKAQLVANGNLLVTNAQFTTVDVGKMVVEGVNNALAGIRAVIPQFKSDSLKPHKGDATVYEKVTASFKIADGLFTMPDFAAVSAKGKGVDLKGNTQIALKDYKLKAAWELIDTYDLTEAKKLAVDINGVHVAPLLAEPGQPVKFSVLVGGTLFAPEPSYTATAEALSRVALANVGRAATNKLKAEALKEVEKKAGPAVKKALEGLTKGIKF
ncbi:AsmA family protein, partial [bacterium]|nr:AsmA family protein [bacterium]